MKNLWNKIKNFFKKSKSPNDEKLKEIYSHQQMKKFVVLQTNILNNISHPWYLQDDVYSSSIIYYSNKRIKVLPRMGDNIFRAKNIRKGDIIAFTTLKWPKEKVVWVGRIEAVFHKAISIKRLKVEVRQ